MSRKDENKKNNKGLFDEDLPNYSSSEMTKAEAAKILGVSVDANEYQIEDAYTKKNMQTRGKTDEQSLAFNRLLNTAYDTLRGYEGYDYKGKEIAGKKTGEWKNIWHYGKWYLLVAVIIIALIASFIISLITKTDYDLTIGAFGDFYSVVNETEKDDQIKLEEVLKQENPEIEDLLFNLYVISQDSKANQRSVNSSLTVRTLAVNGVDDFDLLILDKNQFDYFMNSGVLYPLDDLYSQLLIHNPENLNKYVEPLSASVPADSISPDWDSSKHIYGLSLSKEQNLNSLDLLGEEQILCIYINTDKEVLAKASIFNLIDNIEEWYDPNIVKVDQSAHQPDLESEYFKKVNKERAVAQAEYEAESD